MLAMLDPNAIVVLSASCCNAAAALIDRKLSENLEAAMTLAGDTRPVIVENVTSLRKNMKELKTDANGAQLALLETVHALFQDIGLSSFPILLIDGRLAFYGGAPAVEEILAVFHAKK